MNLQIILPVIIAPLIVSYFISKRKKKKSTPIMDEWRSKVNSAELNERLFNNANNEEREELIYYFTQRIRISDNYGQASFDNMPKFLKDAYLINEMEAEVNNGGFLQFFTNSSGQYVNETIESLSKIRANFTKSLLVKAVEIMWRNNETYKELNDKIQSLELYEIFERSKIIDNEKLMDELNDLDTKFYEYHDDLPSLKMDYLEKNKKDLWVEVKKYTSVNM